MQITRSKLCRLAIHCRAIGATAIILTLFSSVQMAKAADGDLDPAFGTGGMVTTDLNRSTDIGNAVAVQADGTQISTIEGMAQSGKLHPLQEGFWEEHGLQCGYCTPGMIMAAADLLSCNRIPTEEEIRHAIEGNLCRCTGYQHIVNAIQHAAGTGREG